jgi:hypothetical protein
MTDGGEIAPVGVLTLAMPPDAANSLGWLF